MKWIFTDEFININNVNKLTFDTLWRPSLSGNPKEATPPVLCVDICLNIDGESNTYSHRCKCKRFDVSKLEKSFINFLDSDLVNVFDFHNICKDIELYEDIHN